MDKLGQLILTKHFNCLLLGILVDGATGDSHFISGDYRPFSLQLTYGIVLHRVVFPNYIMIMQTIDCLIQTLTTFHLLFGFPHSRTAISVPALGQQVWVGGQSLGFPDSSLFRCNSINLALLELSLLLESPLDSCGRGLVTLHVVVMLLCGKHLLHIDVLLHDLVLLIFPLFLDLSPLLQYLFLPEFGRLSSVKDLLVHMLLYE